MAKIKWRDIDEKNVINLVRQFNAKITRVQKRDLIGYDLQPERLNTKALIATLKEGSRADFNVLMNKYRRYLTRGAEDVVQTAAGVVTTKWEVNEAKIAVQTINARRRAELKGINPSTYKGTMGLAKDMNLRPRKDNTQEIPPQNWDEFVEGLEKQLLGSSSEKKWEQYRQNYLAAMRNMGFDNIPAYGIVEGMDIEDFTDAVASDSLMSIDFIYDHAQWAVRAENINKNWIQAANDAGYSFDTVTADLDIERGERMEAEYRARIRAELQAQRERKYERQERAIQRKRERYAKKHRKG